MSSPPPLPTERKTERLAKRANDLLGGSDLDRALAAGADWNKNSQIPWIPYHRFCSNTDNDGHERFPVFTFTPSRNIACDPRGLDCVQHDHLPLQLRHYSRQGEIVVCDDYAYTFGCSPCIGVCLHVDVEMAKSFVICAHIDPSSRGHNTRELLQPFIPANASVRFATFSMDACKLQMSYIVCQLLALSCKSSTHVVQALDVHSALAVDAGGNFYILYEFPDDPDCMEHAVDLLMRFERDGAVKTRIVDRRAST